MSTVNPSRLRPRLVSFLIKKKDPTFVADSCTKGLRTKKESKVQSLKCIYVNNRCIIRIIILTGCEIKHVSGRNFLEFKTNDTNNTCSSERRTEERVRENRDLYERGRNKLNHGCGWKNQQTRFYSRRFVYPFRRKIVRAAYHFHIITALHLFPDAPKGLVARPTAILRSPSRWCLEAAPIL